MQPRAQYLHAVGPAAVVAAVHELLAPDFGELTFSVARVDLFADWQGFALTAADASRFVCRADARRTYEHAGALTGFDFGSRSTHTFTVRIYDKTAETAGKVAVFLQPPGAPAQPSSVTANVVSPNSLATGAHPAVPTNAGTLPSTAPLGGGAGGPRG